MKCAVFLILGLLACRLSASDIWDQGGACFQVIGNGVASWQLKGAESPLEIEVVVPFWRTGVPAEDQLSAAVAGAPLRHKVVIQPNDIIKRPKDFLCSLSSAEIKSYEERVSKTPELKQQSQNLRLLGHYFFVRPAGNGTFTLMAEGGRSFGYELAKVPVQNGDIFVLIEIQNCL